MFDTSKEIEITIYSGGPKKCTVGWPSDADWKRRAKQVRTKREQSGRDKTKASVIGEEPAALELFDKIRRDTDGEPFDAAEALEVIDRLEYCELCESEDGDPGVDVRGDKITVRVAALKHKGRALFNGMNHTLKHPSMRQIRDYVKGSFDLNIIRRGTETTYPLAASEALYDALVEKAEGYSGAVPVVHKTFVVDRALDAISELQEDGGVG